MKNACRVARLVSGGEAVKRKSCRTGKKRRSFSEPATPNGRARGGDDFFPRPKSDYGIEEGRKREKEGDSAEISPRFLAREKRTHRLVGESPLMEYASCANEFSATLRVHVYARGTVLFWGKEGRGKGCRRVRATDCVAAHKTDSIPANDIPGDYRAEGERADLRGRRGRRDGEREVGYARARVKITPRASSPAYPRRSSVNTGKKKIRLVRNDETHLKRIYFLRRAPRVTGVEQKGREKARRDGFLVSRPFAHATRVSRWERAFITLEIGLPATRKRGNARLLYSTEARPGRKSVRASAPLEGSTTRGTDHRSLGKTIEKHE